MKQKVDVTPAKKGSFLKKEYLIVILLAVVVIVIFLSSQDINLPLLKSEENITVNSYVNNLELSLENILSDVKGAGKINVFITVEGTEEEIVLKNVETKTENGVKTTVETIVLVGGKPYVTKTENPKIIGVAIVCEGADNINVRLSITEIVTTTLKINSDSVRIIKMK